MSLKEYKRKRHFHRTPEPAGKEARRKGFLFVIQKHDARNLHYDFRLEWEGVLKSWAVPKGPCLDHTVKRLAVQVEDHPIEYGSFEGIIPKGEYGGGTVMLWDRGTWEPIGDPQEDFRTGRLKFRLHGQKLRGAWMLLRTHRTGQFGTEKPQWLLFKERDEYERSLKDEDILVEKPISVQTGRNLEEIAAEKDSIWSTKGKSQQKSTDSSPAHREQERRSVKSKEPTISADGARLLPRSRELLVRMQTYDAKKQEFARVRLTSPEKVLYPEEGITKLELAAYYEMAAEWMLPHIAHRPIVLVRCPEGTTQACFYQKHPPPGTPANLRQITVSRAKKQAEKFLVVDNVQGLISLAQIAALEIHAWGSREDKLDYPDRLIFDLDPDEALPWSRVIESGHQVHGLLKELGLHSFVKTTGGKGLHIVVPIDRRHDWEAAKSFARAVADVIVKFDPRHFTANMSKAQRKGKIYIDYLRNAWDTTAVIPYSPRLRVGGTVSVPIDWQELSKLDGPQDYTIRNLAKRLTPLKRDPWAEMKSLHQSLTGPLKTIKLVLGR